MKKKKTKSTIESHYHGTHPSLNTTFNYFFCKKKRRSMYHKPTGERVFPKEMAEQRLSWTGKKKDTNKNTR